MATTKVMAKADVSMQRLVGGGALLGRIQKLGDLLELLRGVDFGKVKELFELVGQWRDLPGDLLDENSFSKRIDIVSRAADLITDMIPGDVDDEIADVIRGIASKPEVQGIVLSLLKAFLSSKSEGQTVRMASMVAADVEMQELYEAQGIGTWISLISQVLPFILEIFKMFDRG